MQHWTVGGDGAGGFVFEPILFSDADTASGRAVERERVVAEVEQAILDASPEGVTPTALRGAVSARPQAITDACIALAKDEGSPVERKQGTRAGSFVYYVPGLPSVPVPGVSKTHPGTERNARSNRSGNGTERKGTRERKPSKKRAVKPFHVPGQGG